MIKFPLEPLYERYGVPYATLSVLESKRRLLEKLLEKPAALTRGTEPIFAQTYLKMLREHTMPEAEVDSLIEQLIYETSPKAFDPPRRQRRPEDALILRSQIARTMKHQQCGVSKAAQSVFGQWGHTYSRYQNIASRFHQVGQALAENQAQRTNSFNERLTSLVTSYCGDATAVTLWLALCHNLNQYYNATAVGDFGVARYCLQCIDDVLASNHPFIAHIVLCCSNIDAISLVENNLGPLLERLQHSDTRKELFENYHGPALSEREAIELVLRLFNYYGYLQTKTGR